MTVVAGRPVKTDEMQEHTRIQSNNTEIQHVSVTKDEPERGGSCFSKARQKLRERYYIYRKTPVMKTKKSRAGSDYPDLLFCEWTW